MSTLSFIFAIIIISLLCKIIYKVVGVVMRIALAIILVAIALFMLAGAVSYILSLIV